MFESHENIAMRAAILCQAVCVSDIMTKTGKCGTVECPSCELAFLFCFLISSLAKSRPTWLWPEELKS